MGCITSDVVALGVSPTTGNVADGGGGGGGGGGGFLLHTGAISIDGNADVSPAATLLMPSS